MTAADRAADAYGVPASVATMSTANSGKLVVISGPSGAGKTTLLQRIFQDCPCRWWLAFRPPRGLRAPASSDGRDYHFLSREEFARRRASGRFPGMLRGFRPGGLVWHAAVEVTPSLAAGKWVVLEIDVQGTMAVLRQFPEAVTIFVQPGSLENWSVGCANGGPRARQPLPRRLDVARHELESTSLYRHQVINDNVERAAQEICEILNQECRNRGRRPDGMIDELARRADREQGGRPLQAVDPDSKATGGAQRRQPAAGESRHARQAGDRDPGDHAGQDLPRFVEPICSDHRREPEAGGGPPETRPDQPMIAV